MVSIPGSLWNQEDFQTSDALACRHAPQRGIAVRGIYGEARDTRSRRSRRSSSHWEGSPRLSQAERDVRLPTS